MRHHTMIDNAEAYKASAKVVRERGGNGCRVYRTTEAMQRDMAPITTDIEMMRQVFGWQHDKATIVEAFRRAIYPERYEGVEYMLGEFERW